MKHRYTAVIVKLVSGTNHALNYILYGMTYDTKRLLGNDTVIFLKRRGAGSVAGTHASTDSS